MRHYLEALRMNRRTFLAVAGAMLAVVSTPPPARTAPIEPAPVTIPRAKPAEPRRRFPVGLL